MCQGAVVGGQPRSGPPEPLRLVVCDSDELGRATARRAAEEAGFEVLPPAVNAVEALHQVDQFDPAAVLIVHELYGMTGLEAVIDLNERPSHPETILVTSRDEIEQDALAKGAFGVVPRGDLAALEAALAELHRFLVTGNRRRGTDRRSGADRRQRQDWSQVTRERRGGDRRRGPRRSS